jgi:polyhydroxybutyrate depolymerase
MKRVHLIVLGVALAASLVALVVARPDSSSAPSSTVACRPGDRMLKFTVEGEQHEALMHLPRGAGGRLPLVLAFHGAYSTARDTSVYYGLSRLADQRRFAVLYPQASHGRFWELEPRQHDDVGAVQVLLDRVARAACVDPSHVYATGVSNGGGFAARLGCDLTDRLAAIAPVAGGYAPRGRCHPDRPLPVLEVHGTDDDVVPYGGSPPGRARSVSGFQSIPGFLREWAALDGCHGGRKQTTPRPGVTRLVWDDCAGDTVVEHLKLAGTAHGWPGGYSSEGKRSSSPDNPTGLDTAEVVWDFLSRF